MKKEVRQFRFFNNETEHVIFYYSLPPCLTDEEINEKLERKREEIAILNRIYVFNIYWLESKEIE